MNYCAALGEGAFEVSVRERRTGKSTQHWSLELTQSATVAATASVVCGQRRAVWSHHQAEACNDEAMRAQGTHPLLCTADAHLFADGFADQIAHLWSKDGRLLATSTQIVWYKE